MEKRIKCSITEKIPLTNEELRDFVKNNVLGSST